MAVIARPMAGSILNHLANPSSGSLSAEEKIADSWSWGAILRCSGG